MTVVDMFSDPTPPPRYDILSWIVILLLVVGWHLFYWIAGGEPLLSWNPVETVFLLALLGFKAAGSACDACRDRYPPSVRFVNRTQHRSIY
jgi:hypothetical protein